MKAKTASKPKTRDVVLNLRLRAQVPADLHYTALRALSTDIKTITLNRVGDGVLEGPGWVSGDRSFLVSLAGDVTSVTGGPIRAESFDTFSRGMQRQLAQLQLLMLQFEGEASSAVTLNPRLASAAVAHASALHSSLSRWILSMRQAGVKPSVLRADVAKDEYVARITREGELKKISNKKRAPKPKAAKKAAK